MNNKPPTCSRCPLWGPGLGFVPDDIKGGCRLIVYHTFPSEDEEHGGRAGIDQHKTILKTELMINSDLKEHEIGFAHVVRCRARQNRRSSSEPDLSKGNRSAIYQCRRYDSLPSTCQAGVVVGAEALKALFGWNTVADEWRGYFQYHDELEIPMVYLRSYEENAKDSKYFKITQMDLQKIGRFLKGTWPIEPEPFTFLR